MSNNYAFIIQARSGSKRLPNKIILPFYNDKTILDIQLENIQKHFPNALIVLATTTNKADDAVADKYAYNKKLHVFRGDEDNVLKRFIDTAKQFKVEHVVRICADNPFLSMDYCENLIQGYYKTMPDYASYGFSDGTPAIRSHTGLFAEMVCLKALEKALQSTGDKLYLEHVTNYIYGHPADFKLDFIPVPAFIDGYLDKLRLTIDTIEDFKNLQKLYLALLNKYGAGFTIEQLLKEVDSNKELISIMKEQIKQYAK